MCVPSEISLHELDATSKVLGVALCGGEFAVERLVICFEALNTKSKGQLDALKLLLVISLQLGRLVLPRLAVVLKFLQDSEAHDLVDTAKLIPSRVCHAKKTWGPDGPYFLEVATKIMLRLLKLFLQRSTVIFKFALVVLLLHFKVLLHVCNLAV